jgi:uncharacterized Ntn-hydrolase superfamily protein
MQKLTLLTLFVVLTLWSAKSQDTFSIVAVDSVTGEVGSAGASCVDLFQTGFANDDFLGVLFPNVGAINTQAYYVPANQNNATTRMNAGDTPGEIINWLIANDVNSQPELRQYGLVRMVNGAPQSAGYTGASTDNYKNHIAGPNYCIQGNILLGQQVLDSMEARFLREDGDLACKLMAALQGANMVGADTRCSNNGSSSLFAFVKVAQPTDAFGSPSLRVSVRTANNAGIEPIDSLQTKFNLAHGCGTLGFSTSADMDEYFQVFPNPSTNKITISAKSDELLELLVTDIQGKAVLEIKARSNEEIDISSLNRGNYFLRISHGEETSFKDILVK